MFPAPTPSTTDREGPDVHTTAAQRLQRSGRRYTAPRRRVVAVLVAADRPLTITEIMERDDALAQSSAYRNLNELIAAGVVHRIIAGDEFSHFELAEELTSHHHHLVCTHCGQVADFVPTEALESTLDGALATVARTRRFRLQHHRLDLIGVCAGCAG